MRRQTLLGSMFLLLCGCAGPPPEASPVQSSVPATTTTTPVTTSSSPFEPVTTDLATCLDGVCTVEVTTGTTFPLDPAVSELSSFEVTKVGPGGIECNLYAVPRGAFTLTLPDPGDSAAGHMNIPTWVTLVSLDGDKAVVALGHLTPP